MVKDEAGIREGNLSRYKKRVGPSHISVLLSSTLVASFRTWPGTQTENTREPNPITEIVCGSDTDYHILIPEKCKSFLVQNRKNDTVCLFFVNCIVKIRADV